MAENLHIVYVFKSLLFQILSQRKPKNVSLKMSWALGPGPLARPVPSGPLGPDPGPMGPWDPGPCPDPGTYKLFASPRSSPRGEFIFRKRTF